MVTFGDSHPYVNEEYIEQLGKYLTEFKALVKDNLDKEPTLEKIYSNKSAMFRAKYRRAKFLKGKLLEGLYSCYMEVHDGSCCPEYRPVFVEILKVVNKTW